MLVSIGFSRRSFTKSVNLGLAVISTEEDGLRILPRMMDLGGGVADDVDVSTVAVVVDGAVDVSLSRTGRSPFAPASPPAIMFGVMTVPESTENRYLLAGESPRDGYCGAGNMMVAFGSFRPRTELSALRAIGTISETNLFAKTSPLPSGVVDFVVAVVVVEVVVEVVEVVVVVVVVVMVGMVHCRLYMVRFSIPG